MNENVSDSAGALIRQFIVRKFPAARKQAIHDAVPLLESRVIDSLGVLDVVVFLEQSFSIKITDEELTPDNFANIDSMAAFVRRKQGLTQVPVSAQGG